MNNPNFNFFKLKLVRHQIKIIKFKNCKMLDAKNL